MYGIIKDVLVGKNYNLSVMIKRIEKRCMEDLITEEQRDELLALANQNASAEGSKASEKNQIEAIFNNLGEMGQKIIELEKEIAILKGVETLPNETQEEYPEWVTWDGIGLIPYQKDSKVTRNGVKYISQVDNNIWGPGAPGVYENIWKKVIE